MSSLNMSSLKALIVDDKINIREVCELYLGNMGCFRHIAKAPDGVSGIRMLENEQFDIILLDFDLPKKNGVEFVRDLVKLKSNQIHKIIVVSGRVGKEQVQDFARMGVRRFLMKPFDEGELQQKVLSVMKANKELEEAKDPKVNKNAS